MCCFDYTILFKFYWYVVQFLRNLWRDLVCVTDQETALLSNLCGRCKSLAPEIVSWSIPLRGISCASGERLAALAFRLRRTLAPSALALRARFSSRLRRSYLGQLPRIESLTKTRRDFQCPH